LSQEDVLFVISSTTSQKSLELLFPLLTQKIGVMTQSWCDADVVCCRVWRLHLSSLLWWRCSFCWTSLMNCLHLLSLL